MKELLINSAFFGVFVSIIGYEIGGYLKKKFAFPLFNPLLISIIFVIGVLLLSGIDYNTYNIGAKYLSYLLTPATVCLAIPLYEQFELLKKNALAIVLGVLSGVIAGMGSILLLCLLFKFNHTQYVTLLPKSVTTAIGMGISKEQGGVVTITVAVIIITGILGNVIAEKVCKIFRIIHPIAKGIAIGSASHAIGTVKAIEMGEVEGAMSGLAVAVAGLLTVIVSSVFVNFL